MLNISEIDNEYYNYLGMVAGLFTEQWEGAIEFLRRKTPRNIKKLDAYMPIIYRRWYFSSLTEDSLLSPANLIAVLNRHYGLPETAALRLCQKPGKKGFEYSLTFFEAENHPLIADLKHLMENIGPTYDAAEPGNWNLQGLTMRDGEYLRFLHSLALNLRLAKKMPSVGRAVGMVNSTWKAFFDNEPESVLKRLAGAVLDICIEALGEILPLKKTYKQKMMRYFTNSKPVDEIFNDLFADSGIDIIGLFNEFDYSAELLDELNDDFDGSSKNTGLASLHADIMSGAFFMGVQLDRLFFTPLAYYCRFIQPLYILPCNVKNELECMLDMLGQKKNAVKNDGFDELDVLSMVYSPCTIYALTALGFDIAGEGASNTEKVFLPPDTPVKAIIPELRGLVSRSFEKGGECDVVTVKIIPRGFKSFWVNAELDAAMPLNALHLFICANFSIIPGHDYSFYPGRGENPFAEYTNRPPRKSRLSAPRENTPAKTKIADLASQPGDAIFHKIDFQDREMHFDITIMKTERKSADSLPRIARRGKGYTEQ
ncbi:MAG: hypothetical protein FWE91_02315 [Defluviitaleaceae bacterium]|nr:hypothetical protein [Defluviitaleaceae bacterium]